MLDVTVPDIHRSLDKAVQATVIPAARVRGIYIDAARLEQYEQALVTAAIGGDEKAIATAVRVQERKATPLGSNAPLRVDSIALATEVGQPLSSTEPSPGGFQ